MRLTKIGSNVDASAHLFQAALGITEPWYISSVRLDQQSKVLEINIDFHRGSRFTLDGHTGILAAYDTREIRYRHLNFFQFQCELVVRVPRVRGDDGSLHEVSPPWAGNLRGFTVLFEALIVLLVANGMTFAEASRMTGASPYQVKEIVVRSVNTAIGEQDLSQVRRLAIDETSKAKGHDYVTVVADADGRCVIDVQPGRGKEAITAAARTIDERGGDARRITDVSIDLSKPYIAGVADAFAGARLTIDKFHVIQHANQAMDLVRRAEQRSEPELKGTRWALRRGFERLSVGEHQRLTTMLLDLPGSNTTKAWICKEGLRSILKRRQPNVMRRKLIAWCRHVARQADAMEPMKRVAQMITRHLKAIANVAASRMTNGFLESLHAKFQVAKRKARGFRSFRTIRAVIFLHAGKLDFSQQYGALNLPT